MEKKKLLSHVTDLKSFAWKHRLNLPSVVFVITRSRFERYLGDTSGKSVASHAWKEMAFIIYTLLMQCVIICKLGQPPLFTFEELKKW